MRSADSTRTEVLIYVPMAEGGGRAARFESPTLKTGRRLLMSILEGEDSTTRGHFKLTMM